MTIDQNTTIRISFSGTVLTLRRPDRLTDGDRSALVAELDLLLQPFSVHSGTYTSEHWRDTGGLASHWFNLIVDVDGIAGYHSNEFTRAQMGPYERILAMANRMPGEDNPGRDGAVRLLANLRERMSAQVLQRYLRSEIQSCEAVDGPGRAVGDFVGFGCTGVAQGGKEWIIDPETGCIVAPVVPAMAG